MELNKAGRVPAVNCGPAETAFGFIRRMKHKSSAVPQPPDGNIEFRTS
jgi:hypothetical protein